MTKLRARHDPAFAEGLYATGTVIVVLLALNVCVCLLYDAVGKVEAAPLPAPTWRPGPAPYGTPFWPTPRGMEPTRTPLPTCTPAVYPTEVVYIVRPNPTDWAGLGMPRSSSP